MPCFLLDSIWLDLYASLLLMQLQADIACNVHLYFDRIVHIQLNPCSNLPSSCHGSSHDPPLAYMAPLGLVVLVTAHPYQRHTRACLSVPLAAQGRALYGPLQLQPCPPLHAVRAHIGRHNAEHCNNNKPTSLLIVNINNFILKHVI